MVQMFSRSYYAASATELLLASPAAVLGELVAHHTFAVDQNQRNAWQAEIVHLQEFANDLRDSFLFLEFAIPQGRRRPLREVCDRSGFGLRRRPDGA